MDIWWQCNYEFKEEEDVFEIDALRVVAPLDPIKGERFMYSNNDEVQTLVLGIYAILYQ